MDLGLTGKNAIVLASSQGLGYGVAAKLAAEGANVLLTARNADRLAAAAAQINAVGPGRASTFACDLGDVESASRISEAAGRVFSQTDILVNNCGGPPATPASEISAALWTEQFSHIALPIFELSRLILPGMRQRRWGRIITIGSSGVEEPIRHLPLSNALRAGLAGWLKTLASEVAADGVTVNMMIPGRIKTDRVVAIDAFRAAKDGTSTEQVIADSLRQIPAGRYGRVEEFAAAAAFLAGVPASYITGSLLRVDGGMIGSL
ncbi:SDR family oxidoreductase [Pelagibacterium lacus]|uniref:SDR family NAD(P)-dependent oxidoreductase n=1 Tax=Pelagibacterium lacus TaxID=2282655 RepID=A0A369W687_9HYPH|nr:SDR family oxidoreductase [Pelagibacterium lacus]RDE09547.1 SDR family NAD(P)-dependent oxidoreductase [Pelagibacterium lacus]